MTPSTIPQPTLSVPTMAPLDTAWPAPAPHVASPLASMHTRGTVPGMPSLLAPPGHAHRPAHEERWGFCPLPRRAELAEILERSGLRGHGGAAFPVHRKLAAMPARGGTVIVNACDGDPLTAKDAVLAEASPHLELDGLGVLVHALRAGRHIVAVHEGPAVALWEAVLAERRDLRDVEVLAVPARYISSQSSAVVAAAHGRPALPTDPSVRATDRARGRRPVLLHNAETVARLAVLVRSEPAAWPLVAGGALLTVTGPDLVRRVCEAPAAGALGPILDAELGSLDPASPVLLGGVTGTWTSLGVLRRASWDATELTAAGLVPGTGAVTVLDRHACVLAETLTILRFSDRAAAHQCGPCHFGLPSVTADLQALVQGLPGARAQLERRMAQLVGRGGCSHPTAAMATAASALQQVDELHLRRHEAGRSCGLAPGHLAQLLGGAR